MKRQLQLFFHRVWCVFVHLSSYTESPSGNMGAAESTQSQSVVDPRISKRFRELAAASEPHDRIDRNLIVAVRSRPFLLTCIAPFFFFLKIVIVPDARGSWS